jgi:hypothetical protein
MSSFGVFHTVLSVLPIPLGLFAFVRDGKITLSDWLGKLYLITMLLGTVSAFGFIPSRGFNPPQVLTLITLVVLLAGTFSLRGSWRPEGIVQTISFSFSYFLLMFFATTETLTRLPSGHPFASGPTDPALLPVRLGLLIALIVGVTYQLLKLRAAKKVVEPLQRAEA